MAMAGTAATPEDRLTRELLERQRRGVETQLRWAMLHDGDRELLDLLRHESDRLSARIEQQPARIERCEAGSIDGACRSDG
jgi:hypothetical protein